MKKKNNKSRRKTARKDCHVGRGNPGVNKYRVGTGDCFLTGCSAIVAENAPRNPCTDRTPALAGGAREGKCDRNEEGRGDPAGSTFAASWKSARTFGSVLREPCPYGS